MGTAPLEPRALPSLGLLSPRMEQGRTLHGLPPVGGGMAGQAAQLTTRLRRVGEDGQSITEFGEEGPPSAAWVAFRIAMKILGRSKGV